MNLSRALVYFLLGCILTPVLHGEVFSSIYKLKLLAKKEENLLRILKQYNDSLVRETTNNTPVSDMRLFAHLESSVNISCRDESYPENPLNVLHLLNRYINMWPLIPDIVLCNSCAISERERDFNQSYHNLKKEITDWPKQHELQAAVRSFLRLRTTYYLDISKVIQGNINEEKTEPLSLSLIQLIIKEAEYIKMWDEALLWSDALLDLLPELTSTNISTTAMFIDQIKARILHKASFTADAADLLKIHLKKVGVLSIQEDYTKYKKKLKEYPKKDVPKMWPFNEQELDSIQKQLCRGVIRKSNKELSSLSCYMVATNIPYFKSKAEEVNKDPKILIFHEVITENEIAYFKEESYKVFIRSGLQNYGRKEDANEEIRLSYTGWVFEKDEISRRISKRIGLITKLDTRERNVLSSSESYQVANYGIGGYFKPHLDNLHNPIWRQPVQSDAKFVKGSGDRIATWMFYLNDVRAGGATIFPRINTRIPVTKGSAAFWYNIFPNGEVDERVLHGGCPVLLGSKWSKRYVCYICVYRGTSDG
ncbi:prolyl 4-hydroxylase [Mytilus galloprovincialis]|uniref:procollagen-proline 4-dioxygenase n=1 Tax=Mytilus galloprovincialis TaxID=29158 RepID=A0A8B6H9I4_MYTGA|nr:prolyl 4-hydroxylase [Mytilus galloprovincialis]